MSRPKRVLVTGATGFIGSHLVKRLIKEKYEVNILTRETSDFWRIKDILPKIKNFRVDLLEEKKLNSIIKKIKPQVVFHLASKIIFGKKDLNEKKLIKTNFITTVNLITACSKIDYQCFINTGSSSEYGLKNKPMKETDVCSPRNSYDFSKYIATLYASYLAKTQNKPIITFRLFSPFGSFDQQQKLIPLVIYHALKNKDLKLASPFSVRDFIYVEDVVDLYLKAIKKAGQFKGEVFNLGMGRQRDVRWIVKKIIKLTNSKSEIYWNEVEKRPWDTTCWQSDMTKTKKTFNWQPIYSTEEGLRKTIDWFKKNMSYYEKYY